MDEFLGHLAAEGRSPNTQSAYQSDLRGFYGFLRTDYPRVDRWQDVTEIHLADYLGLLQAKGNRPATIHRKAVVLGRFFAFLGRESFSLQRLSALPSLQERPAARLSPAQMERILARMAAFPAPTARRDRALLMLLWESRAQVAEVVGLNGRDFDASAAEIVLNRGNAQQSVVSLSLAAADALSDYLAPTASERTAGDATGLGSEPLLRNQRGGRLTRQGIWLILRGWGEQTQIHLTPRLLRRGATAPFLQPEGNEVPVLLLDGLPPATDITHPSTEP